MKVAHLAGCILALTLAGKSTQASAGDVEDRELLDVLAQRLVQLEAFVKEVDSPTRTVVRGQAFSGLQTSSLSTGTLRPANGLGSTARGLTPLADWSRIFPRKEQR